MKHVLILAAIIVLNGCGGSDAEKATRAGEILDDMPDDAVALEQVATLRAEMELLVDDVTPIAQQAQINIETLFAKDAEILNQISTLNVDGLAARVDGVENATTSAVSDLRNSIIDLNVPRIQRDVKNLQLDLSASTTKINSDISSVKNDVTAANSQATTAVTVSNTLAIGVQNIKQGVSEITNELHQVNSIASEAYQKAFALDAIYTAALAEYLPLAEQAEQDILALKEQTLDNTLALQGWVSDLSGRVSENTDAISRVDELEQKFDFIVDNSGANSGDVFKQDADSILDLSNTTTVIDNGYGLQHGVRGVLEIKAVSSVLVIHEHLTNINKLIVYGFEIDVLMDDFDGREIEIIGNNIRLFVSNDAKKIDLSYAWFAMEDQGQVSPTISGVSNLLTCPHTHQTVDGLGAFGFDMFGIRRFEHTTLHNPPAELGQKNGVFLCIGSVVEQTRIALNYFY